MTIPSFPSPTAAPRLRAYLHLFTVALKMAYPNVLVNTIVSAVGGEVSVAGAARFDRMS